MPEDHPLFICGEKYLKRAQEKEGLRDAAHMRSLYRLFCQLLIELKVFGLADLRQSHIEALTELFDELPKSYGKSPRDVTLPGARARGAELEAKERGIEGKTINKHLSALNQLLERLRDIGVKIDPDLAPNKLRFKIAGRQRGIRKSLTDEDLSVVFALPCFTGCKGWRRREPFEKGSHVFHRALYFATILLYYLGARRNEICGLQVDDVVSDCAIPHVIIRENDVRGVKNAYSERKVPLHPEAVRLGFLKYVAELKALGYSLVFPDLYSPTSLSPLGDRLYDELMPALKVAIPEEGRRKKVIHSLRTTWGARLKKAKVSSEERADTLGHSVKSVTEEVYADDTELADQLVNMMKLPNVTGHLQPAKINLLPWVRKKETAPFSQTNRSRKAHPRS
jgi:integrase